MASASRASDWRASPPAARVQVGKEVPGLDLAGGKVHVERHALTLKLAELLGQLREDLVLELGPSPG